MDKAEKQGKMVYLFEEGRANMRSLLGGKGAGLAEMTRIGLPVPPGMTITTEVCRQYYKVGNRFPDGLRDQIQAGLAEIEKKTEKMIFSPVFMAFYAPENADFVKRGAELLRVTPMAAVAVCRAVEHLCGAQCGIKWCNDVVLAGRKLCGILTESQLRPDGSAE